MKDCLFCSDLLDDTFATVLRETEHWYVVLDNMPVNPGHLLFITKGHYEEWFSVPVEIQLELIPLLNEMKAWVEQEYGARSFNFGFNSGPEAGQTVYHVHLHLIPRYAGDTPDPRGGVRGVIPKKQKYPALNAQVET